jgi:hypothetical protein
MNKKQNGGSRFNAKSGLDTYERFDGIQTD